MAAVPEYIERNCIRHVSQIFSPEERTRSPAPGRRRARSAAWQSASSTPQSAQSSADGQTSQKAYRAVPIAVAYQVQRRGCAYIGEPTARRSSQSLAKSYRPDLNFEFAAEQNICNQLKYILTKCCTCNRRKRSQEHGSRGSRRFLFDSVNARLLEPSRLLRIREPTNQHVMRWPAAALFPAL